MAERWQQGGGVSGTSGCLLVELLHIQTVGLFSFFCHSNQSSQNFFIYKHKRNPLQRPFLSIPFLSFLSCIFSQFSFLFLSPFAPFLSSFPLNSFPFLSFFPFLPCNLCSSPFLLLSHFLFPFLSFPFPSFSLLSSPPLLSFPFRWLGIF